MRAPIGRLRRAVALFMAVYLSVVPHLQAAAAVVDPVTGNPAATASAAPRPERVPVVLVHGMRGSGPSTFGQPRNEADDLSGPYLALCRAGYEPGTTLFVCDYEPDNTGDFREIARRYLRPAVDEALAASGAPRVDIIARSMGGLVARAYISSPDYRGDVRTLVLIAVPNRGSFLANIVKAVEMVTLQEQVRQRGAGHRRTLDRPLLPPDSQLVAPFADEVSYVARQSQDVWEPLFGHYYTSAWLLAERPGGGRPEPPPFLDWLRRLYPAVYQVLIEKAQYPPIRPGYISVQAGGFVPLAPRPGEGLTRAYYELLAIQCARHNWFLGMQITPPEVPAPAPKGGLIERAVAWLQRVLLDHFGSIARRHGQSLGIWAMEHLVGLDPKARAADCLIEEHTSLSLGGPMIVAAAPETGIGEPASTLSGQAAPGDPQVVANYYLKTWNEWDALRRTAEQRFGVSADGMPPGVRIVSIAGQIPNLYAGWWQDVNPNDLAVETSSTYLPLEDNDAYHLLPSLVSTNHVWISGGSGKSWRILVDALRSYYPVRASYKPKYTPGRSRLALYTRRGQARAETYQPAYLELQVPAAGMAGVKLCYTPEGAPGHGYAATLRAWAYLDLPGSGLYRYALDFLPGEKGAMTATLRIPVPQLAGARLLVGTRVESQGSHSEGPPHNSKMHVNWELTYDPQEVALAGSGWGDNTDSAHGGPGTPGSGPQNVTVPAAPSTPQNAALPSVSTSGGLPVIRATHRDKQTVSLKPVIHRHQRWEWDFGDGTTSINSAPGSTSTEVSHTYGTPGTYICTAVSRTADGVELARWEWQAEVGAAQVGVPVSFTASTVGSPDVRLRLDGPASWVTGRAAEYKLTYELSAGAGEGVHAQLAYLYPGPAFEMVWEKPGRFTVTGALALRLTYRDGGGVRSVLNVYTVEREVAVYATVVTD